MNAFVAWPLRVALSALFLVHGIEMLSDLPAWRSAFDAIGIPLPALTAPAVAALEVAGGAALFAGILVRPAAAALGVVMVVVILAARLPAEGFAGFSDGWALDFVALGGLLTLMMSGGGSPSLSNMAARHPAARPAADRSSKA